MRILKLQHKYTIYLIILVLISSSFCKEKSDKEPIQNTAPAEDINKIKAIALFSLGDVQYGDSKLKTGETIEQGKLLKVGKKSHVDLQVIGSSADVSIRIHENSEFTFIAKANDGGVDHQFSLKVGSVMFQMKKVRPTDTLKVVTPTTVAAVRGTKFVTVVKPDRTSSVELLEGSLGVRPRIETLDKIPSSIVDSNESLKQTRSNLEQSEIILEKSQKFTVTPKEVEAYVKESGLGSVLSDPELVSLDFGKEASPDLVTKVQSKIQNLGEPKTALSTLKVKSEVETIPTKDYDQKLKAFEELVKIEREKIETSTDLEQTIKAFNKDRAKILQKKIEVIFDQPTEVLVLKDGTRHIGVLVEEGGVIIVLSPEGRKEFKRDQIDSREELEE
jgi:hypothetical protein